jgi:membrane protein DedA with SNARE-associated domain
VWNALGGVIWASGIGLLAYFLGHSAGGAVEAFGIYGLVAFLLAVLGGLVLHRRHARHGPRTGADGAAAATTRHPHDDEKSPDA